MKISDIAKQLGYADDASFTRAFERWTGLSSRVFREQDGNYKYYKYYK